MKEKPIRILIVDDHQIVVDGLKLLLSDEHEIKVVGYANNGKEALDIIKNLPVDVVLMDIDMPLLSGLDATKFITSQYPEIKIIALTSYNEKAVVKKMLAAGAMGYILKSIDKKELICAIKTVFDGKNYFSSEITFITICNDKNADDFLLPLNSKIDLLTSREIEILKLIAQGMSNKEVSEILFISDKTVKAHRENIMKKLDIHNIAGLVRFAVDNKLIN